IDVAERLIHARKPDIGHVVQVFQPLHHLLPERTRGNLSRAFLGQLPLQTFYLCVELVVRDRALVAGHAQTLEQLDAIKRFSTSISLGHTGEGVLEALIGGAATLARVALPEPSGDDTHAYEAGIYTPIL